jgi:hypothetical protein
VSLPANRHRMSNAGGPLFAVGSDNGANDPLVLQQPTP